MNEALLNILACPSCHAKLYFDRKAMTLACLHEQLQFDIHDDIPNLTLADARRVPPEGNDNDKVG